MKTFGDAYTRSLDRLGAVVRDHEILTLSTLGPAGTSSDHAARHLHDRLIGTGHAGLRIELHPTFDAVMDSVAGGTSTVALVPSAYRDATAFHWHPKLRLFFHFVHPTPTYGLAARQAEVPERTPLRISTMSEVSVLYPELCPPALRDRDVDWVPARSTMDAARALAHGEADLALTNDHGRDAHNLYWLSHRPGAQIVWLLFTNLPLEDDER
ncbi:prephenate dehydratase [Krasilnikovia sp. MM14-A1259]|uniref:prephenate dehydratase n=1 Tax=Krasilnikovia sp. MM14-A1259 TaxID=3373539 RepID=UPI0037F84999